MKAAPHPIAYSLIYNLYKLMPNDTDLTMFRKGGLDGLNFAFGMGLDAYHDPSDTPDNLDPASLQHHGEYMLSLSKHFGNLNLQDVKQEDRIYFNIWGWNMISYPQSWAIGFMIFGALLFVVTVGYGVRRRRMSLLGMVGGFLLTVLSLGVVYGVTKGLWSVLLAQVSNEQYETIILDSSVSTYYLVGLLGIMFIVTFMLIRWISRYIRSEHIWSGALLLWLLLCVGTTLYLPGGSYLFTWPFIVSTVGLYVFFLKGDGASMWASALSALPEFVLFAPISYLIYILMTLHMAEVIITVAALTFTLIYPLYCRKTKIRLKRSSREYVLDK